MAASRVQLNSLPAGTVLRAGSFLPASGASAFVYSHGSTTPVDVYVAETGGATLAQPLTADSNGMLPGWVLPGQDLDVVATYGGQTSPAQQAEPAVAGAPVAGAELTTHKDQPGGYAGLDGGGLLKTSELPPSVVNAISPNLPSTSLEAAQPLFPRLMASLAMGQRSLTWLTLTDSTGRDDTGTGSPSTGWVQRTASYLAAKFPAYTVNYYTVSDDGAFGVTISAATVLQTGTGGSPPVLNVYNAAIGGKNATFFINSKRQGSLVKNLLPDAVTISFGHNSTTETTQWWWPLLALGTMVLANSAGCELGLIAQNPEISPSANTTQQQARVTDVARVAEILGCPFINVCQAFIDTGNVAAYVNASDGIHPSGTNTGGQALWAQVVQTALLKGLYTNHPPAVGVSPLHKSASNLVTNGAMQITAGVLTGWTLSNVTVAQDSTNFERTAQGYAAQLTAASNQASGNYIKQTLDLAQCKGRWVTAIMRYYAASGQTDDVHIGRIGISDGVKDAAHSLSFVNQNDRNGFSLAVCSLQVDPAATAVEVDIYVTSGSSGSGSVITVQDVAVVLGPEPRGLALGGVPGPTGAAGPTGSNGPLAAMTYAPAATTIVTTSTTLAALDATNLTVGPFTAPASGNVLVRLTGLFFGTSNGIWGTVLHGTSTKVGRGVSITRTDALGTPASVAYVVTGLTPGNSYQFDWAATAASTFNAGIGVGDSSNTYTANAGPATMEVWGL